ncbi:winged helix-turn-helix domain-containing protein [Limnochorda pilosa]|uniref:Transcriptional regulator n=1 Tax=Limnochorda pilosa TaxID=1555112 RepID=A0A0K2SJN6_LIMPI|nr:response regulator transcription factor [Limnochorda pilosa]BAS27064.1 transcriptional regulator [Limnochorda pilosa]
MPQARILVVDDEVQLQKALRVRLEREGYQVEVAGDGEEALRLFDQNRPDLVILDVMLPRLDGFGVCSALRERSDTPIIILSARSDELDKLVGFRLGVDDYMTKPFSLSELVLRVAAVLRRAGTRAGAPGAPSGVLRFPTLEIDARRRHVVRQGQPIQLTAKEFDLLWLLASHPQAVFSREQILEHVWQSDYAGDLNNVTVLVSRLREKLEADPAHPSYIETVRGVGYRFCG